MISMAAAFAILYVSSSPWTSHWLLRGLEGRFSQQAAYPRSAAIVILGGAGVPAVPPRLEPETNAYGDRILYGAMLFRKGFAPRIVVTGGKLPYREYTGSEADINASLLIRFFGIDSSALILADGSWNTREDALWVRRRFEELGLEKKILLVTSAAHMPRAYALFRKNGFQVTAAPTDFHTPARMPFYFVQLLPEATNLYDTCFALHEYFGYWAYRIFGWI